MRENADNEINEFAHAANIRTVESISNGPISFDGVQVLGTCFYLHPNNIPAVFGYH